MTPHYGLVYVTPVMEALQSLALTSLVCQGKVSIYRWEFAGTDRCPRVPGQLRIFLSNQSAVRTRFSSPKIVLLTSCHVDMPFYFVNSYESCGLRKFSKTAACLNILFYTVGAPI